MAPRFNPTQELAIEAKNDNILIAAGAGSGKSTVLVERLMRKILAKEANVDEFLIVTFTNLAAKEMLEKLRKALNQKLSDTTEKSLNDHLQQQLYKLPYANVSTFHGFCTKVINRYYYLVGLDATTSIIDELESTLLLSESLENFMDTHYEDADFKFLSDIFGADRSDIKFKTLFTTLYKKAIEKPDMTNWLTSLARLYQIKDHQIEGWAYYGDMQKLVMEMLESARSHLKVAQKAAEQSYYEHGYLGKYEQDLSLIDAVENGKNYDEIRNLLMTTDMGKFPARNTKIAKAHWEQEAHDASKEAWEMAKKTLETLRDKFFAYTLESHQIHFAHGSRVVQIFKKYINLFHEQFTEEKRILSKVDFSDLERLTLRIITENKDVLTEISTNFKEIMIDEYQDTNPMQEVIVRLIAEVNPEAHVPVFMVGDIKQAIYRFRGADPSIFKGKYDTFEDACEDTRETNAKNCKIDLMKNYRSSHEVIEATNHIFRNIMNETVGKIDYNKAAELELGKSGDENPSFNKPMFYVINEAEVIGEEKDPELKKAKIEAHFIGQKIRTMIDEKEEVWDTEKKSKRPVTASDMVLLLRSMTNAATFYKILKDIYQIPVFIETTGSLLEEIEILTIRSMLQTIDNPHQDIPLVASLRSPLFAFTEQDLATIRIHQKGVSFYESLKSYNQPGTNENLKTKVSTFLTRLNKWRLAAKKLTISEILQMIYEETGYYFFILGLDGGETKQANLDLFIQIASDYEQRTFKGIYGFLRHLDYLESLEKELPTAKVPTTDPGLKIMTIHKSKGLEFPVVFIASLNREFDRRDESGDCIIHKDYGLGLRYIDPVLRLKQKTLPARLLSAKIHEEMLAEEMRLLYVALTRAESKLILTGVAKDGKSINKLKEIDITTDQAKQAASSFTDWVLPVVVMEDERNIWGLEIIDNVEIKDKPNQLETLEKNEKAPIDIDFEKAFAKTHRRAELTEILAKQSVTQRKIEETVPLYKGIAEKILTPAYDRPSFMADTKATEIGTAFHQFMQHLPVEVGHTLESLENLQMELVERNIIKEKLARRIDLKSIVNFTKSDLYLQLLEAKNIQKELPFTMLFDARKNEHAKALLQGIIDLLAEFETEVWIVDYKTDKVRDFNIQEAELRRRYDIQIKYYLQAMKDIYPDKKIVAKVYFMNAGAFIDYS